MCPALTGTWCLMQSCCCFFSKFSPEDGDLSKVFSSFALKMISLTKCCCFLHLPGRWCPKLNVVPICLEDYAFSQVFPSMTGYEVLGKVLLFSFSTEDNALATCFYFHFTQKILSMAKSIIGRILVAASADDKVCSPILPKDMVRSFSLQSYCTQFSRGANFTKEVFLINLTSLWYCFWKELHRSVKSLTPKG